MLDGRSGAFYNSEIAFVFDNADRYVNLTGGLPEALDLSTRMSRAWVHFARPGDPGHAGLPAWPAVSGGKISTMVFDTRFRVKDDPEGTGAGRSAMPDGSCLSGPYLTSAFAKSVNVR